MLKFLASIYDPVGIISPVTLLAKDMYGDACDLKLFWDQRLLEDLMKRWTKWIKGLPHQQIEVPRSMPMYNEKMRPVPFMLLQTLVQRECAAVYAVVDQLKGKSQGLLTSKSRLAKKNLTILRLELIATHMATNLLSNARIALHKYPIPNCYGWSDSTKVLFWLQNNMYKQFVSNRVHKIKQQNFLQCNYVPTAENPADIGSRGCKEIDIKNTWANGPSYLSDRGNWPKQITIQTNNYPSILRIR